MHIHIKSGVLQVAVTGKQTFRLNLPCRTFIKECPWNQYLLKRSEERKQECVEEKVKLQCSSNFRWSSGARMAFKSCLKMGLAGQDFILLWDNPGRGAPSGKAALQRLTGLTAKGCLLIVFQAAGALFP